MKKKLFGYIMASGLTLELWPLQTPRHLQQAKMKQALQRL